jgi:hypothetical protein
MSNSKKLFITTFDSLFGYCSFYMISDYCITNNYDLIVIIPIRKGVNDTSILDKIKKYRLDFYEKMGDINIDNDANKGYTYSTSLLAQHQILQFTTNNLLNYFYRILDDYNNEKIRKQDTALYESKIYLFRGPQNDYNPYPMNELLDYNEFLKNTNLNPFSPVNLRLDPVKPSPYGKIKNFYHYNFGENLNNDINDINDNIIDNYRLINTFNDESQNIKDIINKYDINYEINIDLNGSCKWIECKEIINLLKNRKNLKIYYSNYFNDDANNIFDELNKIINNHDNYKLGSGPNEILKQEKEINISLFNYDIDFSKIANNNFISNNYNINYDTSFKNMFTKINNEKIKKKYENHIYLYSLNTLIQIKDTILQEEDKIDELTNEEIKNIIELYNKYNKYIFNYHNLNKSELNSKYDDILNKIKKFIDLNNIYIKKKISIFSNYIVEYNQTTDDINILNIIEKLKNIIIIDNINNSNFKIFIENICKINDESNIELHVIYSDKDIFKNIGIKFDNQNIKYVNIFYYLFRYKLYGYK